MTPDRPIYQSIEPVEVKNAEAALARNNPDELLLVAISVGMYAENLPWGEAFCLRLAKHSHFNVRGNAILRGASRP